MSSPSSSESSGSSPAAVDQLLRRVADQYESLPRQLKSVAGYLEQHRPSVMVDRVSDIAERCGVHPSAVVRFAQHFGFSGFSDLQAVFRRAYTAEVAPHLSYQQRIRQLVGKRRGTVSSAPKKSTGADVAREFIAGSRAGLDELAASLDAAEFDAAVDLLRRAETIYVAGVRRSYAVASYTTYALQHTRKRVVQVSGLGGMTRHQIHGIRRGDVLFAISFTPYGRETQFCARVARQQGADTLLVTDNRLSALAKQARVVLAVKESSVFAFRSLTNTMTLCQALFIALAYRLELTIEEGKEPGEAEIYD